MGRWSLGLLFCVWPLVSLAGTNHFLLTVLSPSTQSADYLPVSIDESVALRATMPGAGMWIPLPDGIVHLDYRRKVMHPDGTWTWIGAVAEAPNLPKAVITFGDHVVFGTIPTVAGKFWRLTTLRGKTWLVDPGLSIHASARKRPIVFVASEAKRIAVKTETKAAPVMSALNEATVDQPATVDLLVMYTQGFRGQYGSRSAALARINYEVDTLNQTLQESRVFARIRLVHASEVAYPDTADDADALSDLRHGVSPVDRVPAMREQYGADEVALMRAYIPGSGSCSSTYVMGYNLAPITIADAARAFLVLDDDADGACFPLPGSGLAEVLGGNYGLMSQDTQGTPGPYPFSYAYRIDTPGGAYPEKGTLEADGYPGYAWPYFSNPDINLCDGGPCGVPDQSDAARSLNLTLPIIATFEPTKVVVHNDVNGDGKSDLLWFSPSSDRLSWWIMNGGTMVSHPVQGTPSGWKVVATGDFDGNGKADIVWSDPANNIYFGLSDGNGFTSRSVAHVASGWRVAGSGDFDGDGRSDLLWYNAASSEISWWLMDGTAILSHPTQIVSSGWRVATTGDFSGDGKFDIVWTDASNKVYFWSLSGSSFASAFVAHVSNGWAVVGSGDVDGDGKEDLLWHNASSSWLSWWLMNGATILSHPAQAVNVGWHVAATGDFDGGGNTAIVWEDSASNVYLWRLSGSSYTSQTVGRASAAWSLVP